MVDKVGQVRLLNCPSGFMQFGATKTLQARNFWQVIAQLEQIPVSVELLPLGFIYQSIAPVFLLRMDVGILR